MTKGGSNKPNVLGRLIFGEKRKQHASPSRHRSTTRNGNNTHEVPTSPRSGTKPKQPINIHDWAIWRMHLNEQMGSTMIDQSDLKQMRQYLQSNAFYQQHSRDPSTGRYNGARLLFSIPHAKIKPELVQVPRDVSSSNVKNILQNEQNDGNSHIDDRTITSVHSVNTKPMMTMDKTISQLLPKNLLGNTGGFLPVNEQMIAADAARTPRSIRAPFSATDRVHSTLQKAVKDGNVLEKIKAFEMQAAAAAQTDSTPKMSRDGGGSNAVHLNRVQPIPTNAHRTLSPTISHPLSPPSLRHELPQQQHIRTHRSRYAHPVQQRRDGSHPRPMTGHESRKGAHVLEPAHGDIILKRRTPSQRTINDEDYSMTVMSSMALSPSQSHHHRHHHSQYPRTSASRSRHRQEPGHEKRSASHHEHVQKKHHQKHKELTTKKATSPSNKTSRSRSWLPGRKETSNTATEKNKQDLSTAKLNKNKKNKKSNEQSKETVTKKATCLENNRVYGVPNTTVTEQTKSEEVSPQPASQIVEEDESIRDEKKTEMKKTRTPLEEAEEEDEEPVPTKPTEKRANQKPSSTAVEILNKVEDDTRFSRPTDDHAHRSDFNDEDDECQSDGDVFLEDIPPQKHTINAIQRQHSMEETPSDRRWQWSKEIGGLIEKSVQKKQQPITILTRKSKINTEDDPQMIYEVPKPDQTSSLSLTKITSLEDEKESISDIPISKQLLHSILNSKKTQSDQVIRDEFFEHGPHTNPEETTVRVTSTA